MCICFVFFFKQKTAYEVRISDWSSDVCSSDLAGAVLADLARRGGARRLRPPPAGAARRPARHLPRARLDLRLPPPRPAAAGGAAAALHDPVPGGARLDPRLLASAPALSLPALAGLPVLWLVLRGRQSVV